MIKWQLPQLNCDLQLPSFFNFSDDFSFFHFQFFSFSYFNAIHATLQQELPTVSKHPEPGRSHRHAELQHQLQNKLEQHFLDNSSGHNIKSDPYRKNHQKRRTPETSGFKSDSIIRETRRIRFNRPTRVRRTDYGKSSE